MKKVVCNVVYSVRVPVWYDNKGMDTHNVGDFAEEQDAYIAGKLYQYALKHIQFRNAPKKVYRAILEEKLIPEGRPTGCYNNLDEFFVQNRQVRDLARFCDKSFVNNLVSTATKNYKKLANEEESQS